MQEIIQGTLVVFAATNKLTQTPKTTPCTHVDGVAGAVDSKHRQRKVKRNGYQICKIFRDSESGGATSKSRTALFWRDVRVAELGRGGHRG